MANATALKVVQVAKTQLGVHESPSGSNNVKYNTWFYGRPVFGGDYSWCATFLDWIFEKAGCGKLYPHNANAAYGQNEVVSKCGGSWILKQNKNLSLRKDYVKNKARIGDVVDFNFSGLSDWRQHTGIVVGIDGTDLITIEGNTSAGNGSQSNGGEVAQKTRSYKHVVSAARPDWPKGDAPDPKPAKKTSVPSYKVGKTYTTAVDCLNVRKGAGTSYKAKSKKQLTKDGQKHANAKGQLRKGTNVTCQKVKKVGKEIWIKIPSGWICAWTGSKKYVV